MTCKCMLTISKYERCIHVILLMLHVASQMLVHVIDLCSSTVVFFPHAYLCTMYVCSVIHSNIHTCTCLFFLQHFYRLGRTFMEFLKASCREWCQAQH